MSRPWMPLYVADYLADTTHLSGAEHGAYMLLIMHYWQRGGLPTDDERLASIARASLEQWSSMRATIAEFFDDGWRHKRIDEELRKSAQAYEKRANAGRKGGLASQHKPEQCSSNAQAMLNQPQPQSHTTSLRSVVGAQARKPPEAVSVLSEVLPEETAQAVVDHRRAIRSPLTPHAAGLLAKQFAATGEPQAAAEMMVSQGWRGFRRDWFDNARSQGPPSRAGPSAGQFRNGLGALAREIADDEWRRREAENSGEILRGISFHGDA